MTLSFIRGLVKDFVSLCDEYSGYSSGKPSSSGDSQRISCGHRSHSMLEPKQPPVPPPDPVPRPIPMSPQIHQERFYDGRSLEIVEERKSKL